MVQLREKNLSDQAFLNKALLLKDLLDRYNVPLIINDNLPVAVHCGAAGIHVGNSDSPPTKIRLQHPDTKFLGYSIEYEAQLETEDARVSDYLALSPVYATNTKTDTVTEWKTEGIHRVRQITNKPLVAIGGINEANAASIITAGADCLAIVSAICSAENPALAAERLRNLIDRSMNSYEKI